MGINIFRDQMHKLITRLISGNPFLKNRLSLLELQISNLQNRISDSEKKIHQLDYEMSATPFMSDRSKLLSFQEINGSKLGFQSAGVNRFTYADFEEIFRGTEKFIKGRMDFYLRYFEPGELVLDVGCGRGELLKVLNENGVKAHGIEPDFSMFEIAKRNKLQVEQVGWVDKFRNSEANSLDGIILIQVLEHLPPESFLELFKEANRILKKGGRFILETVNPHSPAALKTFWLDLTHTRPIYPESILELALNSNFDNGYIVFPYGEDNWDHDMRFSGEYAAIIKK